MGNLDPSSNLKENYRRHKRVQRLKNTILLIAFIWIIVSIISIIGLAVYVRTLKVRLTKLEENTTVLEQLITGEETTISTDSNSKDDNSSSVSTGMQEDDEVDQMKVYLTFDDGPSDNTSQILDILDEYGVKATFFVIGKEDSESKALYKRIVDEGHTIGMHSYSHDYSSIYSSLKAFKKDFKKIKNCIYEATGVNPVYYRFPGGSSNQVSNVSMYKFISYLNSQDITYFDWNVSSGDATSEAYSTEDLISAVMGDVVNYNSSVVLLHDTEAKDTTVDALSSLIEELQASGAQILPIDEDTELVQHIYYKSIE